MAKVNELSEDLTNPRSQDLANTKFRYIFLFIACLISLGCYFVYGTPATLEYQLENWLDISIVEFNLLYSVYSIPNIIFPLIGGILLDKFGVRLIIVISAALVTVGQAVFSFGVSVKSFYIALAGRGIFGCGGENLDMAQGVLIINWFSDKDVAMAYTVSSSVSLVADTLNYNISPFVYDRTGSVVIPQWIGFLLCFYSLIMCYYVIKLDRKRDRLAPRPGQEIVAEERFNWRDLKKLKMVFWVLLINVTAIGTSVYCFIFISSGFLQDRFGYGIQKADSIMSALFTLTIVASPLFGVIVDRIGKRTVLNIISSALVTIFYICFMVIPDTQETIVPIFLLILLGIGYSISLAAAWSCVPYITDQNLAGTAWGLAYSLGNLDLVVFPILVGYLQETTVPQRGYFWVCFCLGFLGFVGLVTAIWLHIYDKNNGQIMNAKDPYERIKLLSLKKITAFETTSSSI